MALEVKSLAYFGEYLKCPGVTEMLNPSTGETMILACDAIFEQRNFALDDADSIRPLRRKQLELEAILDNERASEPVKVHFRGVMRINVDLASGVRLEKSSLALLVILASQPTPTPFALLARSRLLSVIRSDRQCQCDNIVRTRHGHGSDKPGTATDTTDTTDTTIDSASRVSERCPWRVRLAGSTRGAGFGFPARNLSNWGQISI